MSQERHCQGSLETVAQGTVDDEQVLHADWSHISQPQRQPLKKTSNMPARKPLCVDDGYACVCNFERRLLLKNGGPACLVGRRGSRFQGRFGSGTSFGAVFTGPLAGKRVSVQSKRASCAPRPFYEGVWDLKKDACQLFCCLNNRILCLTEPSGALVQKSLHRNPICCQRSPWKTMNKPPTAPPGLVLTSMQEGLRLGALCSLSNLRGRPGALRAGGCPGPGPCGTRRCRCGP